MIYRKLTIILVTVVFMINYSQGQNKIVKLDGDRIYTDTVVVDSSASKIYYAIKRGNSVKTKFLDIDEVYSLQNREGDLRMFYAPETEDELSVDAMNTYLNAYRRGKHEHSAVWAMAGGFAVGTASMFVSKNPIFNPVIPLAYVGTISFIKPGKACVKRNYPEYAMDDNFMYGYQLAARRKNLNYAIIGSVEGVIIGAIIGGLLDYYN